MIEQNIRQKLEVNLQPDILEIINESPYHQSDKGAESHFRILIVSKEFEGLNSVQRHQKVYQILQEEMTGPIHALSQQTWTPTEWEKKSISSGKSTSPPCQNAKKTFKNTDNDTQ